MRIFEFRNRIRIFVWNANIRTFEYSLPSLSFNISYFSSCGCAVWGPKLNLMVLSVKSSGMASTQSDHFLHPDQKPKILVGISNVFLC